MADSVRINGSTGVQVGGTTAARILRTISLNSGSCTAYDGTTTGGALKGVWSAAGFYGDLDMNMNQIFVQTTAAEVTVTYS